MSTKSADPGLTSRAAKAADGAERVGAMGLNALAASGERRANPGLPGAQHG